MTALVSADQSATVVALPEYRAYIEASRKVLTAADAHDVAEKAQAATLAALEEAETHQGLMREELDIAIEEALR